ncbi:hypothetical protein [Streptomyces xanthophaeus]|uniref:hypothetical protein n=1 Tax=Streptomyces xanthophaeus TaxID=67385 RepID=UPI00233E5A2B|nr:hypothetical protein [Streptomyces xanthophaeus]
MSAWWMTLIQYGSSGALGATGVIAGQRVLARREDKRWIRENAREEQRWSREDRHRWVSERQRVFAEYLGLVSAWRAYVRHLRYSSDMTPNVDSPDAKGFTHDSERLIAEMELLGSPRVAEAARGVWMWFGASSVCLADRERSDENKNGFTRGLDGAYQDLLRAMRDDLGLCGGESSFPAMRPH